MFGSADIGKTIWVGTPTAPGSADYKYDRLTSVFTTFDSSSKQYVLNDNIGGRIYFFVPWKWSSSTLNASPQDGKYDDLSIFLSGDSQSANGGNTGNPGWQPSVNDNGNAFPSPFTYVETNSGSGVLNNGDISLINGYSLPISIRHQSADPNNQGPSKTTSGVNYPSQNTLAGNLKTFAPNSRSLSKHVGGSGRGAANPWSFVDPQDASQGGASAYSNLKPYLLSLASSSESSWLFNESPGGGLNAVASFYSDGTNPYIIIEGSSVHNVSATSNKLESGLWLLPWDSQQLGSYSNLTSAFSNGSGSNRGLSNNQTIYGNAGNALFVASGAIGSGPGQLANPANLNDVLTYFNNNSPSHSYTGSRQYGGDLFLGLVYGFIGSKENLASTAGLPVSNVPTPPTGFGTSAKTAIGKLPSYWWYANGSVFTPKTGSFLGPLAKTQIGHDLWPSFGPVASDPNWNTYAVNLRKNNPDVYTNDSTNGGGMVGPYAWAMDDRMGGNLVYFNTTGNWLNIDLGAPYTGPDNPTPNPSEVFEQVGFIEASTGLWTPPASSSGKTYMTMFVSTTTAADTNIGDQQISLANSAGDVIDTSQFSSTGRISDSLYQGLGSNLSEATSNASFHAIVARTEGKSVGASNVRLIAVPQERFAVKVGAITSAESGSSVQDDNGAWVTSFTDKTSVAFSSGVFDLVNVTSPQSIQLLATSVGRNRNTVVAYRVDSITGSIQNSSGDFVAPGDPGYALLAINNSLLAGDPVVFNFGDTDELSFTESNAELFGIALITNGTIGEFLANNPSNSKGGGPNMFFSIGAANPDGRAHMVSLDAGVIGFEDLWGGGDADFNDVVIAFKNVPITV